MVKINEFVSMFGDFEDSTYKDSITFSTSEVDIFRLRVQHDDYGSAYVDADAVAEMLENLADMLNKKYVVSFDSEEVKFSTNRDYSVR